MDASLIRVSPGDDGKWYFDCLKCGDTVGPFDYERDAEDGKEGHLHWHNETD